MGCVVEPDSEFLNYETSEDYIMSEYLWVEKYRPKKISDCILSEDTKNTFTQFLKQKEIPNLLLSGTQGTGKTTICSCIM